MHDADHIGDPVDDFCSVLIVVFFILMLLVIITSPRHRQVEQPQNTVDDYTKAVDDYVNWVRDDAEQMRLRNSAFAVYVANMLPQRQCIIDDENEMCYRPANPFVFLASLAIYNNWQCTRITELYGILLT